MKIDQERVRFTISQKCQTYSNKTDNLLRFITIDETWIHQYTPKTAKTVLSAGKVKATVFCNSRGKILLITYNTEGY